MKKENVLNILLSLGMVILLLSAFLPLVDVKTPWLRYIFTFAAMLIVVVRVFQRAARRKQTFSLRVRRLFTMEFWLPIWPSPVLLWLSASRQRRRKTPMWSVKNIKMSRRKAKTESNRRIIE